MSTGQTQDIMKAAKTLMNGEYKTPGKLLLWAMAIGQWMVVIFFGGLLLIGLLYIIFSLVINHKETEALAQKAIAIKEQRIEKESAEIHKITEFLELSVSSINERQKMLENLIKIIRFPIKHTLDQGALKQKVDALSLEIMNCNKSKEKYKSELSKKIEHFENPASSKEFKELLGKLVVDKTSLERHMEDSVKEGERWEVLCLLCQSELDKAQSQMLKD
jgi:hypothetical protein